MYSRPVKGFAGIAGFCFTEAWIQGLQAMANSSRLFVSLSLYGSGILFGLVAMRFARRERAREQETRDRLARRLAEEAGRRSLGDSSGGPIPPFVLYLRPFALEGALRRWVGGIPLSKTYFFEGGPMNFDRRLQSYLDHVDLPLINIGCAKDPEGAGHVEASGSSWYERFRQLAEFAAAIVVVPGLQNGIKAEIRWLKATGLLAKVLFFKPKGYPKAQWAKVKGHYEREEGLWLPEFSSRQLSWRVDPAGGCLEVFAWNMTNRKRLTKSETDQLRALFLPRPETEAEGGGPSSRRRGGTRIPLDVQ